MKFNKVLVHGSRGGDHRVWRRSGRRRVTGREHRRLRVFRENGHWFLKAYPRTGSGVKTEATLVAGGADIFTEVMADVGFTATTRKSGDSASTGTASGSIRGRSAASPRPTPCAAFFADDFNGGINDGVRLVNGNGYTNP